MEEQAPPLAPRTQNVVVGCLTSVAGFFGGGMIAVLIGRIVSYARGCVPAEGLPACDWHVYLLVGGLLGLVLLPSVTLTMLRRARRAETKPQRG